MARFATAKQSFYAQRLLARCGYPTDRLGPVHAGLPGTDHLDLTGCDRHGSVLEWLTGLSVTTCSRLIGTLERKRR